MRETLEYSTQHGDIQKVSLSVHLHDICCKRLNLFRVLILIVNYFLTDKLAVNCESMSFHLFHCYCSCYSWIIGSYSSFFLCKSHVRTLRFKVPRGLNVHDVIIFPLETDHFVSIHWCTFQSVRTVLLFLEPLVLFSEQFLTTMMYFRLVCFCSNKRDSQNITEGPAQLIQHHISVYFTLFFD